MIISGMESRYNECVSDNTDVSSLRVALKCAVSFSS